MENIDLVFKENIHLSAEIRRILDARISERKKLAGLRGLMDGAQTPSGKSHAAYYIEQIHARRKALYKHRISLLILVIWLIYILYRAYLYTCREAEIGSSMLGTSSSQALYIVLLAPILVLAYYVIRYLISLKRK